MIILKTNTEHISQVVSTSTHGLNKTPQFKSGFALIENDQGEIQAIMWVKDIYTDHKNDTLKNFGEKFKNFVDGKNLYNFKKPVNLVTLTDNKYYAVNRWILYVQDEDKGKVLEYVLSDMMS